MITSQLINKALRLEFLSVAQGVQLYQNLSLGELMAIGDELRRLHKPDGVVTWIIDRNVNITNACISGCKFCNFYRAPKHKGVNVTTFDEYVGKIEEMFKLGGNQLLLQGGLSPYLKLGDYCELFRRLKERFPGLKLHALGPPEIVHLAKMESITYPAVLKSLINAGLDSLPGAGAEILSDRVRKKLSPGKCTTQEWLDVMKAAHKLGLTTSATMMFGHIETLEERLKHLVLIRATQQSRPSGANGFISFIPWPFQDENTALQKRSGIHNTITSEEYIRMIAISRILLPNVPNIQASWLTVGKETAQMCLHAGANDFGSIMIEENVVSVAGANHHFDAAGIQEAIREGGLTPQLRNQKFEHISP
jgi:cyclic dehypoxanthinyl futalosine synthase